MSYESAAEPIKIGYLMDFRLPDSYPQHMRDDLSLPFELIFGEAREQGLIDRPVEIVYREVEGLPKGSVKAVIDAYGDLVDEGCLAVFGPHITDNCVPTREAIEERFKVPALSVTGSDDWLGEWTFSFPQGSLTDEPIFWADLLVKGGHLRGATESPDLLYNGREFHQYSTPRIDTGHDHGAGDTLAAATTCALAHGYSVPDAIGFAKGWVTECLRAAYPLGHGHGPVNPLFRLSDGD